MRLLIVEDEPGIALVIKDVAIDAGFEITGIAGTMSEALELGAEADIAIIDVRLGDGLTGPSECHCFARKATSDWRREDNVGVKQRLPSIIFIALFSIMDILRPWGIHRAPVVGLM
jgi:CheY-like chemotaxis protein